MWGVDLRADDSDAKDPGRWREKKLLMRKYYPPLRDAFAQVRPGWHTSPLPLRYRSELVLRKASYVQAGVITASPLSADYS